MRWKDIINEDESLLNSEVEINPLSPFTIRPKDKKFDIVKGPLRRKNNKHSTMGDQEFAKNKPEIDVPNEPNQSMPWIT